MTTQLRHTLTTLRTMTGLLGLMVAVALPATAQAGHGRGGRHVVASGPITYINAPATEFYGGFGGPIYTSGPVVSAPAAAPAGNVRVAPIMPNYNAVPDMGLGSYPVSSILQTQPYRYHHLPVNFYEPTGF